MSRPPQLPVFPENFPEIDATAIEKVALFALNSTLSVGRLDQKPEIGLDPESSGLTSHETEALVTFFVDLWKYLIYLRIGGQSLSNILKASGLPPSYIDIVTTYWYSHGPSVYTELARRTASGKSRVQDISWSIWNQTASDFALDKAGQLGIRLNIETDKGTKVVFLNSSQVANLHSETVRIQTEIDKLLE